MEYVFMKMFYIVVWMLFIIVVLFLLDIIFYLFKTVFGLNYKKLAFGFGLGFLFMAIKSWYQKNHYTFDAKREVITETVEEEKPND